MASSAEYLLADMPRVLFPLSTTEVLVRHCGDVLLKYIYEKVLNEQEADHKFLPQTRCYSAKSGLHLRRTVRLDPVAELFIYDLVYRNRRTFRRDHRPSRKSFGYGFKNGLPIPVTDGYAEFRGQVLMNRWMYDFGLATDVASYFNSVYHHDLVAWFEQEGRAPEDVRALGLFLREANAGRSQDCLPQGIHPCKMLGAEFLKFVDNSVLLRSEVMLRLMDDIYLFSDNEETLRSDFLELQQMLGDKGLSLNSEKTRIGDVGDLGIAADVDEVKANLLRVRRQIISVSGDDGGDDEEAEYEDLSPEQVEYLLNLLKNPDVDESDVELTLVLLRDHGQDVVMDQLNGFLHKFPSLARNIYKFSEHVDDLDELERILLSFLQSGSTATEFQLFWITKIVEDHLRTFQRLGDLLHALYEHPNATELSMAKLLEIPDQRFGLPDLRTSRLRTGESNWSSWAAAVGCRNEPKMGRNYRLAYFGNGSPMNRLIAGCVAEL